MLFRSKFGNRLDRKAFGRITDRINIAGKIHHRHAELIGRNVRQLGDVGRDFAFADDGFQRGVDAFEGVLVVHAGIVQRVMILGACDSHRACRERSMRSALVQRRVPAQMPVDLKLFYEVCEIRERLFKDRYIPKLAQKRILTCILVENSSVFAIVDQENRKPNLCEVDRVGPAVLWPHQIACGLTQTHLLKMCKYLLAGNTLKRQTFSAAVVRAQKVNRIATHIV